MFRYLAILDYSQSNRHALDYLKEMEYPHSQYLGYFIVSSPGSLDITSFDQSTQAGLATIIEGLDTLKANNSSRGIIFKIDQEHELNALFRLYQEIQDWDGIDKYDIEISSIRLEGNDEINRTCVIILSGSFDPHIESVPPIILKDIDNGRNVDYFIFSTGYDERFLTEYCSWDERGLCIDRINKLGFDYVGAIVDNRWQSDKNIVEYDWDTNGFLNLCKQLPILSGLAFKPKPEFRGVDYIEALKIPASITVQYCGCMQASPQIEYIQFPGIMNVMIYKVDAESG